MALYLKHVPWFSLKEWHDVYKQIYSNIFEEQEKGYKTLLVWKARNSKLPVGVDCTLSLIQVSLRDREWSEKLDKAELPMYYENDLSMMYSLCIMRFLNHITNIGHTKQTSLFQIAKQINIPEWIVNLRHDAAHGYELPSVGVLRIAVNILLTWLHDEYWVAEIKNMMEYYDKVVDIVESTESEEIQALEDLIEFWTAAGLYIHAKYTLVSEIPDLKLQKTLMDLRTFAIKQSQQNNVTLLDQKAESMTESLKTKEEYRLSTAQRVLLSEISKHLSKNKLFLNKAETLCSILCDNEVFLPNSDFLCIFREDTSEKETLDKDLPLNFIKFWEGFIILLQEKKMLEPLFAQLLKLVHSDKENDQKRHIASLWLCSIGNALIKHKIAQQVALNLSQALDSKKQKLSSKLFSLKVRKKVESRYPELKSPWLNWIVDVPSCLTDMSMVQKLLLNPNQYLVEFISSMLDLVTDSKKANIKEHLLSLINMQIMGQVETDIGLKGNTEYTVKDLIELNLKQKENKLKSVNIHDKMIRNSNWQLVSENENWSNCPFGLLPWQVDREQNVKPLIIKPSKICIGNSSTQIVPGIIDPKNLKMRSEINWNTVLRTKKLKSKKRKGHSDILIDRAIKVIKQQL